MNKTTPFIILMSLVTASCSLHETYRQDISQGQILSKVATNQLKKGMTKEEVVALLGSPVIENFNDDRWEYLEYHKKQGKLLKNEKLTLFFESDKLTQIIKS